MRWNEIDSQPMGNHEYQVIERGSKLLNVGLNQLSWEKYKVLGRHHKKGGRFI